jgi:hypothetical protein
MAHNDRVARARLRSFASGEPVRLKESLHRQLKEREWIFHRADNNLIFLVHKDGAYGVVVSIEDIDWKDS